MNTDLHSVEFTKRNVFLRGNYTTRSVSEVYRRLQVIDEVPFVTHLFARGVAVGTISPQGVHTSFCDASLKILKTPYSQKLLSASYTKVSYILGSD